MANYAYERSGDANLGSAEQGRLDQVSGRLEYIIDQTRTISATARGVLAGLYGPTPEEVARTENKGAPGSLGKIYHQLDILENLITELANNVHKLGEL